jgi:tryptophan-rich sensory protein
MKNMILKPKIWLTILAVMHTLMGVIVSYQQFGSTANLGMFMYMAVVSVYLLYAAFMVEGQAQARLSTVICAPVVVWFIIAAIMKLELEGQPIAEMPMALLPLTLWSMPALIGIMNWNSE